MSSFHAIVRHRIQSSSLEDARKRQALDKLAHANSDEVAVLFGVMNIRASWILGGRHDPIAEILKGAHVQIMDSGSRYDEWKRLASARTRPSSHRSEGKQDHVDGPLVHTVLFGRVDNRTWLQLETHPLGIGHAIDWIMYLFSHENQGPYGSSVYTDKRPIGVNPATYWRELGDYPVSGQDQSVG